MASSLRNAPWGLKAQFFHRAWRGLLMPISLFILLYGAGSFMIDSYAASLGGAFFVHRLKELLGIGGALLCLCLYATALVRYLRQQQLYVTELITALHTLKDGCYCETIHVQGNNELSHLALHLEELRVAMARQEEEHRLQKETQLHLLTSISHGLPAPLTSA